MIEILLQCLGFLVGVHLTIEVIAALYRYFDLWYRIEETWLNTTMRLMGILFLNWLFYAIASGNFEAGLSVGQWFYGLFFIAKFWVGKLILSFFAR